MNEETRLMDINEQQSTTQEESDREYVITLSDAAFLNILEEKLRPYGNLAHNYVFVLGIMMECVREMKNRRE
jgi:hypothetical protein